MEVCKNRSRLVGADEESNGAGAEYVVGLRASQSHMQMALEGIDGGVLDIEVVMNDHVGLRKGLRPNMVRVLSSFWFDCRHGP